MDGDTQVRSAFYMNVVGYKGLVQARASSFPEKFYMNVVGYKDESAKRTKFIMKLFYMNVVGYKDTRYHALSLPLNSFI